MPKLLGEFLQEQQEPFILAAYLLERGYCTRTRPNARFLKDRRRHHPIPNCAGFVRGVFRRLASHNNTRKIKTSPRNGCGENEEDHEFSSARATTLYCSSCSESEAEEDTNFNEKQLSPISVLEETECEASPLHQNKKYNFKKTKGESSSKKLPTYKRVQNFKECMDSSYDQHCINKRAMQQSKKLLVDCVREVIEIERRRDDGRGQQLKKILGAEELWKVVCENVWKWSQESIHEKNILNLVNCDSMASLEDDKRNSASDQYRHEVSMEIGDAILEDIINELFV